MSLRDITEQHHYPGWLMRSPRWIYLHYFFLQVFFLRSRICRKALFRLLRSRNHENVKVLDVGCGEGQYLVPLSAHFSHCDFIGIDLLNDHISFLNKLIEDKKLENCSVIQEDLETHLRSSAQYSLIYIIGVLQYTADPESIIRLAYHMQKPGDQLMIYTPVNSGPEYGFYKLIRKHYGHYDDARDHYQSIGKTDLLEWIQRVGYHIEKEEPHYGFAGTLGHQMMQSLIIIITNWPGILKIFPILFFILLAPIFVSLQIVDTAIGPQNRGRCNGLLLILQK